MKGKGKGKAACFLGKGLCGKSHANGKVAELQVTALDIDWNEQRKTIKFDGVDSEDDLDKITVSEDCLQAMRELEMLGMGNAEIPRKKKRPRTKKAKNADDDNLGALLFNTIFGAEEPAEAKRKSPTGKLRMRSSPRSPDSSESLDAVYRDRARSSPRLQKNSEDSIDIHSNHSSCAHSPRTQHRDRARTSPRLQRNSEDSIDIHSNRSSCAHSPRPQQQGKGKGKGQLRVPAHMVMGSNRVKSRSPSGHSKLTSAGNPVKQPTKLAFDMENDTRTSRDSSHPSNHTRDNNARSIGIHKIRVMSDASALAKKTKKEIILLEDEDDDDWDCQVEEDWNSPRPIHEIPANNTRHEGIRKIRAVSNASALVKKTKKPMIVLDDEDNDWNCHVEEDGDWGGYLYSSAVSFICGQKMKKSRVESRHERAHSSKQSDAIDPWATFSDDESGDEFKRMQACSNAKSRSTSRPQRFHTN